MKSLHLILLMIATQQSLAMANHYAEMETKHSGSIMMTDQQLEQLKDYAENVYPNDPQAQWYLITVDYEARRMPGN